MSTGKKISDLTNAASLQAGDLFEVSQSILGTQTSGKITLSALAAYFGTGGTYLPLSGTAIGSPMTGTVNFNESVNDIIYMSGTNGTKKIRADVTDFNMQAIDPSGAFAYMGVNSLTILSGPGSPYYPSFELYSQNEDGAKYLNFKSYVQDGYIQIDSHTGAKGLGYSIDAANGVSTNQDQYTILHRAANDARYMSAGSAFYQTVQKTGSGFTQRAKLNFGSQFNVVDNSGNGSTDIGIIAYAGDITGSYPTGTVTGLQGSALPALSAGFLKYTGSAWAFDTSTYLTSAVTSISAGTGMSFSTITGTGSVAIDTGKVPYYSAGFSTGLAKWNGSAWTFDNSTYLTAVTGTSNRITITGTSTIDIAAAYVGQTSITTLGTVGTGTWQGTSISTTYTDAKIKGAIAATAGLIPIGTGTADTVTTSTRFKFDSSATFAALLVNGSSGGGAYIGSLDANWGGFWASKTTPTSTNYAFIANGTSVALNIGSTAGNILQFNVTDTVKANMNNSGNFYFGGSTSATALVHIAGSTTSVASMRIESGTAPTSPNSGDIWHSSSISTMAARLSGINQNFVGCIYSQTTPVTVANSIAETSVLTSTVTLPANFFKAGKVINLKFLGLHSAISNPNITVKVKLGSTVILSTGAVNSANSTNALAQINGILTCKTTGASGTISAQGFWQEMDGSLNSFPMTNTSAVTIDTTVSQVLDITVQWGTASASNTITITDGYFEILN